MNIKQLLFSLPLICSTYCLTAQSTINGSNFNPVPGETTSIRISLDTLSSTGGNGANQVWNYAAINSNVVVSSSWIAPAGTPGAARYSGANLCATNGSGYNYYYADNAGLKDLGYCNPNATTGNIVSNADYSYQYPLTYNTSYTEQLNKHVADIASSGSSDIKGIKTSEVRGYGTLILPTGTFTNVLKVVTTTIDTEYYNNALYARTYMTVTQWLYPGIHGPLLSNSFTIYDNSGTPSYFKSSLYTTSSPLAINETLQKRYHFSCYPVPAGHILNVHFNLNAGADVTVSIHSLNGQLISTQNAGKQELGEQNIQVNLDGVAPGIYLADLNISGVHVYQQFTRQ